MNPNSVYLWLLIIVLCFHLSFCSFRGDDLWVMKIKGSAFLWHQIRCMAALLFLIGQGLESPDVSELSTFILIDLDFSSIHFFFFFKKWTN